MNDCDDLWQGFWVVSKYLAGGGGVFAHRRVALGDLLRLRCVAVDFRQISDLLDGCV